MLEKGFGLNYFAIFMFKNKWKHLLAFANLWIFFAFFLFGSLKSVNHFFLTVKIITTNNALILFLFFQMYAEALNENERLKSRLQDSKQELAKIRSQLEKVTQVGGENNWIIIDTSF